LSTKKIETRAIADEQDIVRVRQLTGELAAQCCFNLVDRTKTVTAASELARNTLRFGGGGSVSLEILEDGVRQGLRLTFNDKGPGIPDIEHALSDGFTTGGGLGLGLGGAKRLMHEFSLRSVVGQGTTVVITRWK